MEKGSQWSMERISLHKHLSLHSSKQISLTLLLDVILSYVACKQSDPPETSMMASVFDIHLNEPTSIL